MTAHFWGSLPASSTPRFGERIFFVGWVLFAVIWTCAVSILRAEKVQEIWESVLHRNESDEFF